MVAGIISALRASGLPSVVIRFDQPDVVRGPLVPTLDDMLRKASLEVLPGLARFLA